MREDLWRMTSYNRVLSQKRMLHELWPLVTATINASHINEVDYVMRENLRRMTSYNRVLTQERMLHELWPLVTATIDASAHL